MPKYFAKYFVLIGVLWGLTSVFRWEIILACVVIIAHSYGVF